MDNTVLVIGGGVAGAVLGALGTVAAAFLNRGPAIQSAVAAQIKVVLDESRQTIADLRQEISDLKQEVHALREQLANNGIEPRRVKVMRDVRAPD